MGPFLGPRPQFWLGPGPKLVFGKNKTKAFCYDITTDKWSEMGFEFVENMFICKNIWIRTKLDDFLATTLVRFRGGALVSFSGSCSSSIERFFANRKLML